MAIENDIAFLERSPMLRLMGRSALRIVAIGSENRYVHGGEVLFRMDDVADSAYLVQEGRFSLTTKEGDDARDHLVGPGFLLAEFALLTETRHPYTATAIEPSTVIRISRSLFVKTLDGFPDAARRVRDHVAARAEQAIVDLLAVRRSLESSGQKR
ncbi:MAG: cyclic nucleotide-binding domain-containing protein [Pseudorhodoplanes sp.]|nr:cyclic nucleotide-binding domain-containing protein [Pseudorhodoplanes sp.]